jgi:lysophospholipase L1-like esterase
MSLLRSVTSLRSRLHPNDAGYRAMAEAVDLRLFRNDDED